MSDHDALRAWLLNFAVGVRARDFQRGRTLFADDVASFGTVARRTASLDELVSLQWEDVWSRTEGFELHLDTMQVLPARDRSLHAVLVDWDSRGLRRQSAPYARRGRATLLLLAREGVPHGLAAVHSHFSMNPARGGSTTS